MKSVFDSSLLTLRPGYDVIAGFFFRLAQDCCYHKTSAACDTAHWLGSQTSSVITPNGQRRSPGNTEPLPVGLELSLRKEMNAGASMDSIKVSQYGGT